MIDSADTNTLRIRIRRGFSLIELAVVVSVMSLLLGMIAVMLHGMLQTQKAGLRHVAVGQSLMRLSAQFREDVHAADNVEIEDDGSAIRLLLHDKLSVTYRVDKKLLVRESAADAGNHVGRDAFWLPRDAAIRFSASTLTDDAELIALTIGTEQNEQERPPTWRPTQIEASLGRVQPWLRDRVPNTED